MSVAEILKKAREGRNLTLKDISKKTKISEKLLEKIEAGVYDFAPEPYVRAFVRSYAKAVGLNPDEIIKEYEKELTSLKPEVEKIEAPKIKIDLASFISENLLWLVGALILIFIAFFIFIGVEKEKKQVEKKSFEAAVEEISKLEPAKIIDQKAEIEVDSLDLKITATDSVWFSVIIDSLQVKEFLMPTGSSLRLKAKNSFNFTIGNAGGIKFTLNGHELESLGGRGMVIRNYIIDREKLRSLLSQR